MADAMIEAEKGLDHGVGHPLPFGLARCSSRWTEGRWRYLNRSQHSGNHRAGLLTEESLCGGRPVRTCEEKVVHGRQARTLSGVVESSQLVIPQREVPVAPFHIRT